MTLLKSALFTAGVVLVMPSPAVAQDEQAEREAVCHRLLSPEAVARIMPGAALVNFGDDPGFWTCIWTISTEGDVRPVLNVRFSHEGATRASALFDEWQTSVKETGVAPEALDGLATRTALVAFDSTSTTIAVQAPDFFAVFILMDGEGREQAIEVARQLAKVTPASIAAAREALAKLRRPPPPPESGS